MQPEIANNPNSAMLKEVGRFRDEAKTSAKSGGTGKDAAEELPEGSSPLEASEETPIESQETSEEASASSEGVSASATGGEAEVEPIRIGDREFTSEKEALRYAEQIEQERLRTEAHSAGIREALEATRIQANPTPPPEDDFEQRFYSNPKETLRSLKEEAKREALQAIQAENQKERLWSQFLNDNPDVRRKDAERILQENWETIGRMTDMPKAMKALATRVRAEYAEIVEFAKPRTVLADKKQVLSPSGGQAKGVTPSRKEDAPLAFAAQMRATFKR